jgi:hypothetical protein
LDIVLFLGLTGNMDQAPHRERMSALSTTSASNKPQLCINYMQFLCYTTQALQQSVRPFINPSYRIRKLEASSPLFSLNELVILVPVNAA